MSARKRILINTGLVIVIGVLAELAIAQTIRAHRAPAVIVQHVTNSPARMNYRRGTRA